MGVALVDNDYLANKRNVEDCLKKEGYEPKGAEYHVFSLDGSWGRSLIEMDPGLSTFKIIALIL